MGEAPARSSLVPRDLTAEVVFDCPRFTRAFANVSTPYGVFESVCSYLCYSLCLEFCCLEYALRRSLLVVVGRRSCPLSFAVVFSVVGSS